MPYSDQKSPEAVANRRAAALRHYYKYRDREIARAAAWTKANRPLVNAGQKRRRDASPWEKLLWRNARGRAVKYGIEFTIVPTDIVVVRECPVLGVTLALGNGTAAPNSPSLDRIDSARGYVPGNVRVISHKANTIKSNATEQDLRAVLADMERIGVHKPKNDTRLEELQPG